MYFPVSGVEVNPIIPLSIAFLISLVTTSAGVSGAVLLVPFQMSVLHYTSLSVTPTNFIYNIVATPGGLYEFIKEGRMVWPLTWVIIVGTLPGVFLGSLIRIYYLYEPDKFTLFVGSVLLYLGIRLLLEFIGWPEKNNVKNAELCRKFKERATRMKEDTSRKIAAGLPVEAVIKTRSFSLRKIEYEFWGETYSFSTPAVFVLALAVGVVGGIYGIGGGAIIAPFCVSMLNLPVYTVAGAALAGTFFTSIAGVAFYSILAATKAGVAANLTPDWLLGALFGAGGLLGSYCGANLQKYLRENIVKGVMAALTLFLALNYLVQYFF